MTFWSRLENNPVLLSGFLIAVLNLLMSDWKDPNLLKKVIEAGTPLLLAVIVRSQVSGPLTSRGLAKAITDPPATPAVKEVAKEILDDAQ